MVKKTTEVNFSELQNGLLLRGIELVNVKYILYLLEKNCMLCYSLIDENALYNYGFDEEQTRKEIMKGLIEFLGFGSLLMIKPEKWDNKDVIKWLHLISMENYKEIFQNNQITGKELIKFDNNKLIQIEITPLGHRKKFLRRLETFLKLSQ